MNYDEKRNMVKTLIKRTIQYQGNHPLTDLIYNKDDIYNAMQTLISFLHANANLCDITALTEKHQLPNPAIAYAGAYFLMMIAELQTQGIIDATDFVDIADSLLDHEGIALAFNIATNNRCK